MGKRITLYVRYQVKNIYMRVVVLSARSDLRINKNFIEMMKLRLGKFLLLYFLNVY